MKKLVKGVGHALDGIYYCISSERNIKIQLVISLSIILLAIVLPIYLLEKLLLISMCFVVLVLEMINTGVERLVDVLSPEYNKQYGIIKDVFAGVVVVGSILAVIVGFLILYEPLISLLNVSAFL